MDYKTQLASLASSSQQLLSSVSQQEPGYGLGVPTSTPLLHDVKGLATMSTEMVQSTSHSNSTQGQMLLAGKGYDALSMSKQLHALDIRPISSETQGNAWIEKANVQAHLRHLYEENIMSLLEESTCQTELEMHQHTLQGMEKQWHALQTQMGIDLGQCQGQFGHGSGHTKHNSGSATSNWPANLQKRFRVYTTAAKNVSLCRQKGESVSLLNQICTGLETSDEIHQVWHLLQSLLGKHVDPHTQKEQYPALNLTHSEFEGNIMSQWAHRAQLTLEAQFLTHMRDTVKRNASLATPLHGHETTASGHVMASMKTLVQSYLCVTSHTSLQSRPVAWDASTHVLVDEMPLWPCIYLCLRAGLLQTALELISNAPSAHYATMANTMQQLLSAPNATVKAKAGTLYRQIHTQGATPYLAADVPYMAVCLNMMAHVDPHATHEGVCNHFEDFLWLQLVQTNHQTDTSTKALFTLQKTIQSHGLEHFKDPLKYFRALLLVGNFSNAISLLWSLESFAMDALHFLLILEPLMKISDSNTVSPLVSYMNHFIDHVLHAFPELQFAYWTFLPTESQNEAFAQFLVNHASQRTQWLHSSTTQSHGLLSDYVPTKQLNQILFMASQHATLARDYATAIIYLQEASADNDALHVLIEWLGNTLDTWIQNPKMIFPNELQQAITRMEQKVQNENTFDSTLIHHFQLLQQIQMFLSLAQNDKQEALSYIYHQKALLPMTHAQVSHHVDIFKRAPSVIQRLMPHVLRTALMCLHVQLQQLTTIQTTEKISQQSYRERIIILIAFTQALECHVAPEMYETILRYAIM